MRFVPFASASSYEGEPSWSPDGQSLAYTADVDGVLQVFVKRVGDALSRPLTSGQFDASHPFWTRNGERVYYISQAGEYEALWSVGVAGGRPELELENVSRAAIDARRHAARAPADRSGCVRCGRSCGGHRHRARRLNGSNGRPSIRCGPAETGWCGSAPMAS